MGKSKILGAALAGMLQAQAKRMPKDKILKKNRVGSLVAAHQAADRFAQLQRLRQQLRQELPRGSVGAKLARDLLDSDCESCSGRRRTSHATAAERAADYVKRVRERVVARRLREQAAAKEGDDEEEETSRWKTPTRTTSHWASVGLRTLRMERAAWRAAWELRFPWKGERPRTSRRKPTMEVILDSGASHNVMPRDIYQRLLSPSAWS